MKSEKFTECVRSRSSKGGMMSGRAREHDQLILRTFKTIIGGGITNNAQKKHLQAVMNAKTKTQKEHYETTTS